MQVVLVMFRSDGERRSFSVVRDMTVIGRREDCDLRIPGRRRFAKTLPADQRGKFHPHGRPWQLQWHLCQWRTNAGSGSESGGLDSGWASSVSGADRWCAKRRRAFAASTFAQSKLRWVLVLIRSAGMPTPPPLPSYAAEPDLNDDDLVWKKLHPQKWQVPMNWKK